MAGTVSSRMSGPMQTFRRALVAMQPTRLPEETESAQRGPPSCMTAGSAHLTVIATKSQQQVLEL
jgi:hypothetical protein